LDGVAAGGPEGPVDADPISVYAGRITRIGIAWILKFQD
jgi:hypothetical protein